MAKTKLKNTGIDLQYSSIERAAVLHLLVYNNKTEAFKIVAEGEKRSILPENYAPGAQKYFRLPRIVTLIAIETEKFTRAINGIIENNDLKNLQTLKNVAPVNESDILNKKELIQYISRAIKDNRTDPKTLKDLSANLSKLMQWDKDQEDISTNITFYELPKKD